MISSSYYCLNTGDGLTDSLHGLSSNQVIIVVLFLSSYPSLHAQRVPVSPHSFFPRKVSGVHGSEA